jgi:tetratricopeptide (TPR) repeat protein
MAAEHQDHVHRLIHSLTRSEKRYFKLHLARHTGASARSNHARLFDAIAAMETYDEAQLRERFTDDAFVRHFAITKRRLYEAILHSLDAFHMDSSVDARLRKLLHQTEILYERTLYTEAERMLRSVRSLAQEHHKHAVLLETIEWERRLMERTNYEGVEEGALAALAAKAREVTADWSRTEALWQLKSRSFLSLYRQGKARDAAALQDLGALRADPELADDAEPTSPRAAYLYHHVRSALAFAMGDLVKCADGLERNAALLTKEKALVSEEPNLLLGVLGNLAYVRMRLGRHEEAMEGLKEFRRLPLMLPDAPSPDLEMKVFAMGSSLELTLLARMGRFDKAVEKLPAVEEGLSRFGDRLSLLRRAGIWFQVAWVRFGNGDTEQALRWSHRLLNEGGIDAHEELHALGRMLNLLVLLEMNDRDRLTYALRNTERHLKARQRTHGVEQAILRHVHERMRSRDAASTAATCRDLRDELAKLAVDPLESAAFDHFDPWVWAESKVSGRSMAEVAQGHIAPGPGSGTTRKREAA